MPKATSSADLHDTLVCLWSLRLLGFSLEGPRLPGKISVAAKRAEEEIMLEDFMEEVRKEAPRRNRRRAPSANAATLVDRAADAAGLLDMPFDREDPDAVTELRATLRRRTQACVRQLGKRPPLECLSTEAQASLGKLRRMLELSPSEELCLTFLLLLATEESLEASANCVGHELDDRQADRAIAAVTGLDVAEVGTAFSQGSRLMSCQLLKRDSNLVRLAGKFDWSSRHFARAMRAPDFDPIRALRDRVVPAPAARLTWDEFGHLGELRTIARTYVQEALAARRRGVNFLLHGAPGTGKTEFVRTLAREVDCDLYEVSTEDSDGDPIGGVTRLQALRVVQEFTGHRRSMVVFDEIEDVFPKPHPFFGSSNRNFQAKGWVNRMLEANPTVTCWLTNSVEALDPAFVRRFDLVLEVKAPPPAVREAQLRALPLALPAETIARMVASPHLTPGVVQRAAAVVDLVVKARPDLDVKQSLELVVDQTLRAQGHGGLKPLLTPGQVYDPTCISSDLDPLRIVEGLRSSRAARICLYGPPGTGKTAFGQFIARELGLTLNVRRASDLLSPYVGMAEKQIAAAFREAQESGAALLIDEVDSFLQDRTRARHGWEVTQVNEFLTQMEQFSGLFLASTNLLDGFDPAALRRFDLKARFDYLKAGQARRLLEAHLQAAGAAAPGGDALNRLDRCTVLTPGDFATVARQHRFRPLANAGEWVAALEEECRLKPGQRREAIGFGRPAA